MGGETRERQRDRAALEQARWLADSAEIGWLTTVQSEHVDGAGWVGTPVAVASDDDGAPLVLLSGESPHHEAVGDTATLLITEPAMGGVLPGDAARLTLHGRLRPVPITRSAAARSLRRRLLDATGSTPLLCRLDVSAAQYKPRVGTWLREIDLGSSGWLGTRAGRLPREIAGLVQHLNAEHGKVLEDLFEAGAVEPDPRTVVISAVRPYRLELSALAAGGVTAATLTFARPVATAADLAAELLRRLGRLGWGHCTRTLPRCDPSGIR